MEFNQLEASVSIVKHKSFSKAAKELLTNLLDRKNKTITLTHSGESLYKYAVELSMLEIKLNQILWSSQMKFKVKLR